MANSLPDSDPVAVRRFRQVSVAEGISLLLLMGVAMPLKYLAGIPMATKVVGWVHGALFVAYIVALLFTAADREWKWTRTLLFFVVANVPFGFLVVERMLRRDSETPAPAPAA